MNIHVHNYTIRAIPVQGAKLIITCSSNSNKPFIATPPPEAKYFVNNSGQKFFFINVLHVVLRPL